MNQKKKNTYIGTHINANQNILKKMIQLTKYHCNIVQIMVSSLNDQHNDLEKIRNYIQTNNIKIVIHSSYTNNIAIHHDPYNIFIRNIIYEIRFAHDIGASYIVIHLGKQLKMSLKESYQNMYNNLLYLHHQTKEFSHIIFVLEMVSGQGTELCSTLDELGKFFNKIKKSIDISFRERIKICIDTCHIFAAGYDIRSNKKVYSFLLEFHEKIGLNYVGLIHLNNSSQNLGSHKDRHACLNNGFIPLKSLLFFAKIFLNNEKTSPWIIPIVLETPYQCYQKELLLLSKFL